MTRTTTIDMLDRVAEIRESEVPPRQAQIEEILETAKDEYENIWDIPEDLERRYQRLSDEVERLNGEADTLEHYADAWGDSRFEIRELSAGAVGQIQDDVAEASGAGFDGSGTPKTGYARNRTLEIGIKEKPTGAPEINDIPDAVADWLYDCVDEFNTTGEVSLGNSSLRADLMAATSEN